MKNILRKSLYAALITFSSIIFIAVIISSWRHMESGNWGTILAPAIITFATAILGAILFQEPRKESSALRYAAFGAFVGATGTVSLIASNLFRRFDLIARDGTAYWGLLFIPSIYFGIPAITMGILIGMSAQYLINARKERHLPNKSL